MTRDEQMIEEWRAGAIAALEKRRARADKEHKTRNAGALMAGKTPSDQAHHDRNQAIYFDCINEIREMSL